MIDRRRIGSVAAACAVALACVLVAVSCRPSDSTMEIVAKWNGGELTRSRLQEWSDHQKLPFSSGTARKLALILSMADEGASNGLKDSPQVILKTEAGRQAILLPALKKYIDSMVVIDDDEIEALLNKYPNAFEQPRKLLLRGIYKVLPGEPAENEDVIAKMAELRERVIAGADLAALAKGESDSQSRFRDGRIGFVDPQGLPSEVRAGVAGLKKGEISPIIVQADGISFYRCEDVKPAIDPDPDTVRRKFRTNLFRQRSAKLNRDLLQEVDKRIQIDLDGDPVLTVGQFNIPSGWLDELVSLRLPGYQLEQMSDGQRIRLLREWGRRVALTDYAESKQLGTSVSQKRSMEWARIHALATAELRRRVDRLIEQPSEQEIKRYYREHGDALSTPELLNISVIWFERADSARSEAVVREAARIVADIHAGDLDFGEAADEVSIHRSATEGGNLGWLSRPQIGSIDMGLLRPLRELSVGQDSGLLRLDSGLWLIKLVDRKQSALLSLEQARPQIVEVLIEQQKKKLEEAVRNEQLARMNIRVLVP